MRATEEELAALPPGIVPVAGAVDVRRLERSCQERSRPTVVLDTRGLVDPASFTDAVATALALPGWVGRTWQALAGYLSEVPATTVLVWDGWTDMARAAPRDTELAIEVLAESGLTVLLVNAPVEDAGAE